MDSGILNVAKPLGLSSFGVVRSIGRLDGIVKVGHGGTLDPAADGVLPVLVNAATRLSEFVHEWPKTYVATAVFGFTSDTYDREGTITPGRDPSRLTVGTIEEQLPAFTGLIAQVPPMFSALKQGGEALYRKARRGETVARAARSVEVRQIRLLDYQADAVSARLEIVSGQGMYVRSLVHDLGQALGTGAYLAALRRTAYGPLRWEDAATPAQLHESYDDWKRRLLPLDLPLRDWPGLQLRAEEALAVSQGRSIPAPDSPADRYRLLDSTGRLLGWGAIQAGRIQPRAIFAR
ncbi:MAG TPA: tRNA pseudouridine(55) synthase TruB [Candidatus Dormibacteraeota bacterium]|jgi:tRNA pseudouridine55 synthase